CRAQEREQRRRSPGDRPSRPATNQTQGRTNLFTLFVTNIHTRATEAAFEHLLQQAGLRYARIRTPDPVPGYDANNRGFCFISFENREDYNAAQALLEGKAFAGNLLRTAKAHDRPPRTVKHDAIRHVENRHTPTPH